MNRTEARKLVEEIFLYYNRRPIYLQRLDPPRHGAHYMSWHFGPTGDEW